MKLPANSLNQIILRGININQLKVRGISAYKLNWIKIIIKTSEQIGSKKKQELKIHLKKNNQQKQKLLGGKGGQGKKQIEGLRVGGIMKVTINPQNPPSKSLNNSDQKIGSSSTVSDSTWGEKYYWLLT